MVAAMHDIAVASVNWPYKTVAILLVFRMALSTVIIPPLMRTTLGTPGKKLLTRIYTLTMEHHFFVMGLVFAALTIYLTLSGIRAL